MIEFEDELDFEARDDLATDILAFEDQDTLPYLYDWGVSRGPLRDGTAVMDHDGFDLDLWKAVQRGFPRLHEAILAAGEKLATSPALIRDVFMGLYHHDPLPVPPAELRDSHRPHQGLIEAAMGTEGWRRLHEDTKGDALLAAIGTIALATEVVASIDPQTMAQMNEQYAQEQDEQQAEQQADGLEGMADNAADPDAQRRLREQAQRLREQAQQGRERRRQQPQPQPNTGKIKAAANRAAKQASGEIRDFGPAMDAFALEAGDQAGTPQKGMSLEEKLALAQQVGKNAHLKRVAQMAGRLTRIALDVQKQRARDVPEEIVETRLSADLAHLASSELALLGDPDTEDLFWLKYAEKGLNTLRLAGAEREGRGPIQVVIDGSGSMSGEPEVWSKACALALLTIARRQYRDARVVQFSGGPRLLKDEFPRGKGTPAQIMACVDKFLGGGTDYRYWMEDVLKQAESARFDKSDVILISDGLAYDVNDELAARWNAMRQRRGLRCFALLIGVDEGEGRKVLGRIADHITTLSDLADDTPVLKQMFSIG